ncbi:MAG: DHH family phosphoesterase [Thermoplasmata archaeon]|nr:DHH family phosphoesterase [Thermoplasmata archaeon]
MKRGLELPPDFSAKLREAAKALREHNSVRVISHYDADGITAASVIGSCLRRAGIRFQATITKSLEKKFVERLSEEHFDCMLFLDMGSGQIENLERLRPEIIVMDHHKPVRESNTVKQVNPHFFDLDGMRDISASGIAFAFALAVDDENWESAPIAIAGMIGDMQHLGSYSSINESILSGAMERKLIIRGNGLKLGNGRLVEIISRSTNPYFQGLSGHPDAAEDFIKEGGLDPETKYSDLGDSAVRKMLSILTIRLLRQGCDTSVLEHLWGETIMITRPPFRGMQVNDLTELVNSCGRTEHSGLGMALCMGDTSTLHEAGKYQSEYFQGLLSELRKIEDGAVEMLENIQLVRPSRSTLAGAVCGISMQYLLDQSKPTLALTIVDGSLKVSSRGTLKLVGDGLDLSESMRSSAEALGGVGGGHAVAAGATVPASLEKEFLEKVDSSTGRQLKSKK